MSYKEVLRELMDRQKLSQTKLANASDVPRETIRGWFKRDSAPREWEPVVDIGFALSCSGTDMSRLLRAAGHPQLDVLSQMCGKAIQDAQKKADEFGVHDYQERLSWIDRWSEEEAANDVLGEDPATVNDSAPHEENQTEAETVDEQVEGVSPYMGLSAFEEEDEDLFFGREKLVAEIAHRLCSQSFLAIVGASGSGKSSLVRAGLIPLLKSGQSESEGRALPPNCDQWAIEIVTPKSKPLSELAACLTRDEPYQEQVELEANMSQQSDGLAGYVRRYLHKHEAERLLLVVDQFEELFTHQSPVDADGVDHTPFQNNAATGDIAPTTKERIGEQQAFINNILTAAQNSGRVTVLLTARADFYSRILDFPMLRAVLPEQQINIGPMGEDELRRAIEDPATQNGWAFEPLLVDEILEDMATERGTLPLLSHALLETWERRSGSTLTRQGYRDAGRIQGAIARTAEQLYTSLNQDEKALARNIFIRMTSLGQGTEDTRRRVNLDELRNLRSNVQQTNRLVTQLANARLITTDRDDRSGNEQADIAHEALIQNWDRLGSWLRNDRDGLRIHRRLTDTVTEWQATDSQDESLLYRGTQLELALTWAEEHSDELNESESSFLDTSVTERERRDVAKIHLEQEREEAQEKQLIAAKKSRNRAYIAVGAALTTLLLLLGIGAYFFNQYRQSARVIQAQTLIEESKQLTTELKGFEAIDKLAEAQVLHAPSVSDFDLETQGIRATVAEGLTLEGEMLLRTASEAADADLWDEYYVSATQFFSQALALAPPSHSLVYVKIPAGEFEMGQNRTQRMVQVDEFWMMRTEVTKGQYKRCVNAGKCSRPNDSQFEDNRFQFDPVVGVSWEQADEYAFWVGGRLPTEAEWEYACRGTDGRKYPWGDEPADVSRLNFRDSLGSSTNTVGSYASGISPFGIYDMLGNALEWTADRFAGESDMRSLRGGAFWTYGNLASCALRYNNDPNYSMLGNGFRVIIDGNPTLVDSENG